MYSDIEDDSALSIATKSKLADFRKRFHDGFFCRVLERLYLLKQGKSNLLKNNSVSLTGAAPLDVNVGDSERHSRGTRVDESDYSRVIESFKSISTIKMEDINFIAKEIGYIPIDEGLRMKDFLDYLPATPEAIKKYVTEKNKRSAAKKKQQSEELNVEEECKFPFNYYLVVSTKGHIRVVSFKTPKERENFYKTEKRQQVVNLAELIKLTIKKKTARCKQASELSALKYTRLAEATQALNQVKEQKKQLEVINSAKNMNQEEILEELDLQNQEINGVKKKIKDLQDKVIVLESVKTSLQDACQETSYLKDQMQSMKRQIDRLTEENLVLKEHNKQFEERIEEMANFLKKRDPNFREYMKNIELRNQTRIKVKEFESKSPEDAQSDTINQQDNLTETQSARHSILKGSNNRKQTPSKKVSFNNH